MNPLKNISSIRLKIYIIIAVSITFAFLAFDMIMLKHQRNIYIEDLLFNSRSVSDTILKSLEQDMMADNTTSINITLKAIGKQELIKELRIYNHKGEVRSSMVPDEVGKAQFSRKESRQCSICHQAGHEQNKNHDMLTYNVDTKDSCITSVIVPIQNQARCSTAACHAHSQTQRILGFLNMGVCRLRLQADIHKSQVQILLVSLLFILLLPALIMLFLKKHVSNPLRQLLKSTGKIGRGDLDCKVDIVSRDELGQLAFSFNKMLERLVAFKTEIEGWNEELEERVSKKTMQLKEAQKQIIQSEKMSSLGRLAAVIAHEINNPISGLIVFIKLLQKTMDKEVLTEEDRVKVVKRLCIMESEAKRCGHIVSELLSFSRAEQKMVECNIAEIIERSVSILKFKTKDKQISLNLDIESNIPMIQCDPGKIQQIIMNLVQNAIEALPQGGEIDISACFLKEEEKLKLVVHDNGIGIPEEFLPHIFEPFYSSKDNGQSVGIGLFVVYGVIHQHNGVVEVDSAEGKGTTFSIFLPA
ncbi:MAG: HAMP domain-containing histidine kinase [Acidobacteria bacterium]|nr:HAMP domain-containing histidine kinase [Acidobacteriota bacterium]